MLVSKKYQPNKHQLLKRRRPSESLTSKSVGPAPHITLTALSNNIYTTRNTALKLSEKLEKCKIFGENLRGV
jgi:hypothetical protein